MKATTWFYSQSFNRASDPTNPPQPGVCECCGGEDIASTGECADCEAGDCGVCLASEPAEPDMDAPSFAESHEAAYAAKRAVR